MINKHRVRICAGVIALLLASAVVSTPVINARPIAPNTGVTISGNIGSSRVGWRIYLVTPQGNVKTTKVLADGSFSFRGLAKRSVRNATLQVVDDTNRYVGPIVIAKERLGDKWCAHQQLSGESLNRVTFQKRGGSFVATTSVSSSKFTKAASLASSNGAPVGAASGGIVKLTRAQKNACDGALRGSSTFGSQGIRALDGDETDLGDDTDSDGLPNAFDADDDGDKIIDATDSSTAQTTAAMNPWVSFRSSNHAFNANITPSLTPEDINEALGSNPNNYVIQFFVGNRNFVEGDVDETINSVSWVYVNCGELVYCGGDAPTAIDIQVHDGLSQTTPWNEYLGGWNTESDGAPSAALDPAEDFGVAPKGNALWALNRNGWSDPERIYWRASIFPDQGANTLSTVRPDDVFTLNFKVNDVVKTLAMMLNPHAITVPGLTTVNGSAYEGGNISIPFSGDVALRFYRPQRLAAGEEVGGGDNGRFVDLGGQQYGLTLMAEGHNSWSCPSSTLSAPIGLSEQTLAPGQAGWPLKDQTASDKASSPENGTLGFTVDIEECIRSASQQVDDSEVNWGEQFWTDNIQFTFNLTAAGASLTGGSNTSSLEFVFQKDPS